MKELLKTVLEDPSARSGQAIWQAAASPAEPFAPWGRG